MIPSLLLPIAEAGKKGDDPKEALQALQDYIGEEAAARPGRQGEPMIITVISATGKAGTPPR